MCVYLVPVHATISTRRHYFAVHESHHMVVKKLIEGGDHVKWKQTSPEVRKPSKKQDLSVRKPYKKQDLALRKKADRTGWNRSVRVQSDADILQDIQLRFETLGGEGLAGTRPVFSARTPSWD